MPVSWLWGEPAVKAFAISMIRVMVLTPASAQKTSSSVVVPNGYCLCAHSYCECELICKEIETYSNNAIL